VKRRCDRLSENFNYLRNAKFSGIKININELSSISELNAMEILRFNTFVFYLYISHDLVFIKDVFCIKRASEQLREGEREKKSNAEFNTFSIYTRHTCCIAQRIANSKRASYVNMVSGAIPKILSLIVEDL